MSRHALVLLSGGMDSVTLLHDYQREVALALSFNYGSKHNAAELRCAEEQARLLGIEHLVIPLAFMNEYFKSALLLRGDEIPEGHYASENISETVVPFRNGIMLSVAAGLAESRELDSILIANHAGDHAIYPDCTEAFITNISAAIDAGTVKHIQVIAPYTLISKTEIALRGKSLGVDYAKSWSCYKGGLHHCGKCATCLERKEALAAAGLGQLFLFPAAVI